MGLPAIGTLAVANWNGIAWSQPGGAGTTVYPQEQVNVPFTAYPVGGQIWAENSGLWVLGCGHWQNAVLILRSYDPVNQVSAALICCALCTFVQRIQEPYESIENPLLFPVIIP
jgi:hypothetical protein